jgi:hypothetical protein
MCRMKLVSFVLIAIAAMASIVVSTPTGRESDSSLVSRVGGEQPTPPPPAPASESQNPATSLTQAADNNSSTAPKKTCYCNARVSNLNPPPIPCPPGQCTECCAKEYPGPLAPPVTCKCRPRQGLDPTHLKNVRCWRGQCGRCCNRAAALAREGAGKVALAGAGASALTAGDSALASGALGSG